MQRIALVPVSLLTIVAALSVAVSGRAATSPTALRGTVGPGFTISLTSARGALVKKLKAGRYTITVRDLSPIHDFHLFGPGVDKKTSVQNIGTVTWTVQLRAGVYRYICDPHRTFMHGSFSVS